VSGTKGHSGGTRQGAGPPRRYVITKKPYIGFEARSRPQPLTSISDLTICIAEADGRRGIVIDDIWYGSGEALAIAEYVEQYREWLRCV